MKFRPSYFFFGLNELVGLSYVQNLGLFIKWAPGVRLTHKTTQFFTILTTQYTTVHIFLSLPIQYNINDNAIWSINIPYPNLFSLFFGLVRDLPREFTDYNNACTHLSSVFRREEIDHHHNEQERLVPQVLEDRIPPPFPRYRPLDLFR